MCAASYFSKGDSIFSWKDQALLDLNFLGLSLKKTLRMITLAELKRKWPKNSQEQRQQLCLNYINVDGMNPHSMEK